MEQREQSKKWCENIKAKPKSLGVGNSLVIMALSNAAAGFIGASVTLVLVIIFMILMVILVRQCLAFIAKRNAIRHQLEHQRQVREQIRQRRGSVSEPIPATFDWHHDIRIEGTPPPSYVEAKDLPPIEGGEEEGDSNNKEKTATKSNGNVSSDVITEVSSPTLSNSKIHVAASPDSSLHEITVVQTEIRNGTNPEEARTFITGYTEFGSAQRPS